MSDKQQTTYINGIFVNEFTFNDGGSILKMSIPADKIDELVKQLKANVTDGWVRLKCSKRRQAKVGGSGKVIATHSISVDTWKPSAPARTKEANDDPFA